MRRISQWFAVALFASLVAGCQQRPDPMPMVLSVQKDGAWQAVAPLCAGDALYFAGLSGSVDGAFLGSIYGDRTRVVDADTLVTLDLSVGAVASGDLTTQWPRLEGRSRYGLSASLPSLAEIGFTTGTGEVAAVVGDLDPLPGQPILVTGFATRPSDGDRRVRVDQATADATLETWCADQRAKRS